jgi:hypothetical protein
MNEFRRIRGAVYKDYHDRKQSQVDRLGSLGWTHCQQVWWHLLWKYQVVLWLFRCTIWMILNALHGADL